MKRFVLDCSVTMAWCFEDQADKYTEQVLESFTEAEAMVPALWGWEVANVLLTAERKGKLQPADSARFLDLLADLPITIIPEKVQKIDPNLLSLGRSYGLSSYDAIYLDLATSQGLPLATRDDALRKACKKIGVRIYQGKKSASLKPGG